MRKYSFIFVIALSILSHSCGTPGEADLSKEEKALIAGSDSLMRVLTVFDKEDSLLLRNVSVDFTDRDLLSKDFEALAAKMLHTVQDPSQDGVGIAAPQVGLNRRVICVLRYDLPGEPFGVYPNARLDSLWGERLSGPEGCLSIPGWAGSVPRYQNIIVSYTDPETLQTVKERVEGYTAVIFQHEIDHLDGILYTDRADSLWVDER
ncbi:MAG: peptide deformylase [Bacteroidales bacterium]|nr:peptide deformylase [Bacteroidales bacterium]